MLYGRLALQLCWRSMIEKVLTKPSRSASPCKKVAGHAMTTPATGTSNLRVRVDAQLRTWNFPMAPTRVWYVDWFLMLMNLVPNQALHTL